MTLVRPLVSETRFYALGYLLVAAITLAATKPPWSVAAPMVVLGAFYGLIVAWMQSWKTTRQELAPIERDGAQFEGRRARLRRRLLVGHMTNRARLALGGFFVATVVVGLVAGGDRIGAAGTMAGFFLVYLCTHNVGLMGTFARIEHDANGTLVSTVVPSGELPLLVLPRD